VVRAARESSTPMCELRGSAQRLSQERQWVESARREGGAGPANSSRAWPRRGLASRPGRAHVFNPGLRSKMSRTPAFVNELNGEAESEQRRR